MVSDPRTVMEDSRFMVSDPRTVMEGPKASRTKVTVFFSSVLRFCWDSENFNTNYREGQSVSNKSK